MTKIENLETKLNLAFSRDIQDEIIQNSYFRTFVKVLEISINNFLEIHSINLSCKLVNQDDWEVSGLIKKVLFLDFHDIPFKTQMLFWREISKIIYNRIQKSFPDIKKNFYIKLKSI